MTAIVRIALRPGLGQSSVIVNGMDISGDVVAVQVARFAKDADSLVTLQIRSEVELEGEVARVVAFQPATDPREAVAELLRDADPKALEAESLQKLGVTTDSPTEAILQTLAEWAERDG